MYKCNHCNIEIPDNQVEGRVVKVGPKDNLKCYCRECGEPVVYIPDKPQATGAIHGAQTTLISTSDNRITTNYYYGSGTPDEQIDTPYGPCRKSEARLCKQCRKWVPLTYFNQEKGVCFDCELKESQESFEVGKNFFKMGFYDNAIPYFQKYESVCPKENLEEVKTYLGRCYYEQRNYEQALRCFVFASRNNSDSLFYMGLCVFNGYGVDRDYDKAMEIIQMAAQKGNNIAENFLIEEKYLQNLKFEPIIKNGKWGYIDEEGNIVIPCEWKSIANKFHEDLAFIKDFDDKWGFIDKRGRVVIPCKWKDVTAFHEGLAGVQNKGEKWGFIDKRGRVVIPCKWKDVNAFHEGLAGVQNEDEKWGFIDKTGKLVIPCEWESAYSFNEGVACIRNNNGFGFIEKHGKIVIPCKWRRAESFEDGFAMVEDEKYQYYLINKSGEAVSCKWWKYEKRTSGYFVMGLDYCWYDIDKSGKRILK